MGYNINSKRLCEHKIQTNASFKINRDIFIITRRLKNTKIKEIGQNTIAQPTTDINIWSPQ